MPKARHMHDFAMAVFKKAARSDVSGLSCFYLLG